MKIKPLLTAALLTTALLSGNAWSTFQYPGQKLNRLTLKMIEDAKAAAEKAGDEAAKIAAFIESLESQKEAYKEAQMEYCIETNGVEKAGACSCTVEQYDYARTFHLWALHNLTEQDISAERDAVWEEEAALSRNCGLPAE